GRRSHRNTPGTVVGRTPNSPRYSAGASGFGSHVSIWLGPPRIHRMMTDDAGEEPARAWERGKSARANPAATRTPALRKLRRLVRRCRRKSAQPIRVFPVLLMRMLLDVGGRSGRLTRRDSRIA